MSVPSINAGVGVCVDSSDVVGGGCICVAVSVVAEGADENEGDVDSRFIKITCFVVDVVVLFRNTFNAASTAAVFIASSHIPSCVCDSTYRKENLVTITIIIYICVLHC